MWNSVHPSKGKVGKSSSPQKCRLRNAQGVVRHSSALCGPSYCLFFVAHVSFLGMALKCFHGNIVWWKGVWQISGFICSFADSPWSSYMRPHANFGFLSKLFSWVYQPTEKPICISLSNGCSKQRCPRVVMITWRHCDGRPTEVSPKMFSDPDALSKVTIHPIILLTMSLRKTYSKKQQLECEPHSGWWRTRRRLQRPKLYNLNHSQPLSTILNHQDRPALQDSAGWCCRGLSNFCWWLSNFSFCILNFFIFP